MPFLNKKTLMLCFMKIIQEKIIKALIPLGKLKEKLPASEEKWEMAKKFNSLSQLQMRENILPKD